MMQHKRISREKTEDYQLYWSPRMKELHTELCNLGESMEMNRAFENVTFYNKVKSVYAKQNNKSIKECWQYNKTVEFITNSKWCFMISTKLYLPRTLASRRTSNNRPIGQMISNMEQDYYLQWKNKKKPELSLEPS